MTNKRYIIYSQGTGEILRRVSCFEGNIEFQIGKGEAYLEGDVDDLRYYVNLASLRIEEKGEFIGVGNRYVRIGEDAIFTQLPEDTRIRVELLSYSGHGTFRVSFQEEGIYSVVFYAASKLKKEIKIEVRGV